MPDLTPNAGRPPGVPLPLAQLARRAHNAKTHLERLLTAGYLWEAILKLTAASAVAHHARRSDPEPAIAERLRNLAAPQLGHWREYLRLIPPWLAEHGDDGYRHLWAALDSPRTDLPRCAELDAVFRDRRNGRPGPRGKVRLNDLLDGVVWYRNKSTGHGAVAALGADEQRHLADVLLAAAAEFLECVDALAGRRLVYVDRVEKAASRWVVERFDLTGDFIRLPPLESPGDHPEQLPDADRLYLATPGAAAGEWALLSPLVVFAPEGDTGQVLFLNGCRGDGHRADLLNYLSGEVWTHDLSRAWPPALAAAVGVAPPIDGPRPTESPAPTLAADPSHAARWLGEFELGGLLGSGAMGEVHRARQLSLDRPVAVKILHRLGDRRAEARFAREVVALARVDHPNVVKVFASGVDGGRLFYAMELVEGTDLSDVIDRLGASRSAELTVADWAVATSTATDAVVAPPVGPREPTLAAPRWAGVAELTRVVEVARQVAEAAHALHEAGVIHRDIKPNNVRLATDGRPVLLDLGLAQLMDESEARLTRTRQFVGTLRYASPEQVLSLRLDARADVYSLGATLWELLTLRPLFGATEATPTADLMLRIQTTEPDRVRRHNPRVPADLEAVVFKCLEKDRTRRYASAAELAADLGRWQRGEPVHAQPPSLGYLLRKYARRNRWPIAVAAGVVVALLAVLVGGGLAVYHGNQARQQADAARQLEGDLQQMLDDNIEVAEALRRRVGTDRRGVEQVLRVVATQYERASARSPQTDALRERHGRVLNAFAELYLDLGDSAQARRCAEEALATFQDLTVRDPGSTAWRAGLATAHERLGTVHERQGRSPAALAEYQESHRLRAILAAEKPTNAEWQNDLARAKTLIGNIHFVWDDLPRAEAQYRAAFAIRESLAARDPASTQARYRVAFAWSKLGDVAARGNAREAVEHYGKAYDQVELLVREGSADADTLGLYFDSGMGLGQAMARSGNLAGVLLLLRCRHIAESVVILDPENVEWLRRGLYVGTVQADLSRSPYFTPSPDRMAELQRVRRLLDERSRKDPDNTSFPTWQTAVLWEIGIQHTDLAREPIALNPDTSDAELARRAAERKRHGEESVAALREAEGIAERLAALDPDNSVWAANLAQTRNLLGTVLTSQGDADGAAQATVRQMTGRLAFAKRRATRDPANAEWQRALAVAHRDLAASLLVHKRPADALGHAREAVAILERLAPRQAADAAVHNDLADASNYLGDILGELGQHQDAEAAHRKALAICRRLVEDDPENPGRLQRLAYTYRQLVSTLRMAGDETEVERMYRESRPARAKALAAQLSLLTNPPPPTDSKRIATLRELYKPEAVRKARTLLKGRQRMYDLFDHYQRAAAAEGAVLGAWVTWPPRPIPVDRVIDLAEAAAHLATVLDPADRANAAESARLLGQADKLYASLREDPGLVPEEQALLPTLAAAIRHLDSLPPGPGAPK